MISDYAPDTICHTQQDLVLYVVKEKGKSICNTSGCRSNKKFSSDNDVPKKGTKNVLEREVELNVTKAYLDRVNNVQD